MPRGQDDAESLFVPCGVFQELTIELPHHIKVVIDIDVRPDVLGNRPLEPRVREVEFFPMEEVLHEEVKIH